MFYYYLRCLNGVLASLREFSEVLCRWVVQSVFWCLLTGLMLGFSTGITWAQPGIVQSKQAARFNIDFAKSLPPGLAGGIKLKRWTDRRKILVLKTMVALAKRAPGLIARANRYRPIKFYYLAGRYRATARASVMGNSIEFTRTFFRKGPKGRLAVLAHEITHLADSGYLISGSVAFTDLVSPLIRKARGALKSAGLTWYEAVSRGRHKQVRKFGLSGAYGAFNQEEALAEGIGRYVAGWYKPPEGLKAFFDEVISDRTVEQNKALIAWHRAQNLLATGDRSVKLDLALQEAIGHDAGFAAAQLLSLKRNALQQQGEDFTQAVDLALASAHAPFMKSAVHETAALSLLIKGHADRALHHINQAIAYVPASALLYLLKARVELALKNPKSTLMDYKKAQRLGRFHFTRQDRSIRRRARRMLRQQRLAARK